MEITIKINCKQLTKENTITEGQFATFEGHRLMGALKEDSEEQIIFVRIPYKEDKIEILLGEWLVKFPDGTLEVWQDEKIQPLIKNS